MTVHRDFNWIFFTIFQYNDTFILALIRFLKFCLRGNRMMYERIGKYRDEENFSNFVFLQSFNDSVFKSFNH